jgi:tryptophan synthase beta chain
MSSIEAGVEHRYGPYGGQYVPETLMPALAELERSWVAALKDETYAGELARLLRDYIGRPSPLYLAERLSEVAGREVWLKREDLNHTGSHKINNAIGQALLAKRMGKPRVIAETGAGQHGVATATACALLDLDCVVFMGAEDIRRQQPNVQRMKLLGARVESVDAGAKSSRRPRRRRSATGSRTSADTHYVLGSAVGPAPYPAIVRDLQRLIGDEAREELQRRTGRLPDRVDRLRRRRLERHRHVHRLRARRRGRADRRRGGGGGPGQRAPRRAAHRGRHPGRAARLAVGGPAGHRRADRRGALGLGRPRLPGSGPEHAWLRDSGRATYVAVTDDDAVAAFRRVAELEGIIPALETAHAFHVVLNEPSESEVDLLCLSGRGDKDLAEVLERT